HRQRQHLVGDRPKFLGEMTSRVSRNVKSACEAFRIVLVISLSARQQTVGRETRCHCSLEVLLDGINRVLSHSAMSRPFTAKDADQSTTRIDFYFVVAHQALG